MFLQQTLEDGTDPTLKWALDREIPDEEEPDQEMFLPMTDATKRPSGKFSSLRDWPDDEDDSDVDVIEPVEAVPLSFAFPASANPGGHIHEDPPLATGEPVPVASKKKHGAASSSSSEPSQPTKRQKKVGDKTASKRAGKALARRARKPKEAETSDA